MASLEGTRWILASGISLPQDAVIVRPTVAFDRETVSGSTGCNRYGGACAVDGPSLTLGPLASTLMACAPPADLIEREFVEALARVARWRVEDGELVLGDVHGVELLRFTREEPAGP